MNQKGFFFLIQSGLRFNFFFCQDQYWLCRYQWGGCHKPHVEGRLSADMGVDIRYQQILMQTFAGKGVTRLKATCGREAEPRVEISGQPHRLAQALSLCFLYLYTSLTLDSVTRSLLVNVKKCQSKSKLSFCFWCRGRLALLKLLNYCCRWHFCLDML